MGSTHARHTNPRILAYTVFVLNRTVLIKLFSRFTSRAHADTRFPSCCSRLALQPLLYRGYHHNRLTRLVFNCSSRGLHFSPTYPDVLCFRSFIAHKSLRKNQFRRATCSSVDKGHCITSLRSPTAAVKLFVLSPWFFRSRSLRR